MKYERLEMFCTLSPNLKYIKMFFDNTRKVKVLSLPEMIKEKSTFRVKALRRRELVVDY